MSRVLASSLRDRRVLTDQGLRVGTLYDLEVNEDTGEVESLIVTPESEEIAKNLSTDDDGNAMVPFRAVVAVRDFIVVAEKKLTLQHLKSR